jgi:hypothetical protein
LKILENQLYNFILIDTILFPQGTLFLEFADFNNDNYFDIVYMRSLDSLYIVLNNQDLTFSSPDRYFVPNPRLLSVKSADFDGNGYNDIAYTYYNSEDSVSILFNDGTGRFVENPLTSVESHESQNIDVSFPNPFIGRTTITITLPEISEISVNIYDQLGRKVMDIQNKRYENGPQSIKISTPELTPGVYYFELLVNNIHVKAKKLMIF